MNELTTALEKYLRDPESPETNFGVAEVYFSMEQYAAAATFYQRTAEYCHGSFLHQDSFMGVEALLKASECYSIQGGRNITVKSLIKNAINTAPGFAAPYYYMSILMESQGNWFDAFHYANMGLRLDASHVPIGNYKGKWMLYFQVAVSLWYCSRFKESEECFQILNTLYYSELDEKHRELLKNNLELFSPVEETYEERIKRVHSFNVYDSSLYDQLRFRFKDCQRIAKNYSQIYQDMFVLAALDGKKNGTYLEIGAGGPYLGSNTALLEKDFDWTGVSIEFDPDLCQEFVQERTNKVLCVDATLLDYRKLLKSHFEGQVIDYLQIDIDPAEQSYEVLTQLPLKEYTFKVITFEHDAYINGYYREASRNYLQNLGYVLVVPNVSADGVNAFEDFWIHRGYLDETLVRAHDTPIKASDYFLGR